jgi:hypothetical protein
VGWEISANLAGTRTGVDARGWLWGITDGARRAQVVIEISGTAWLSDPARLSDDTRRALETDGRTELLKAFGRDEPHASSTAAQRAIGIRLPGDF